MLKKKLNKIPAGTFLVPMILSMVITTFWPDLFKVGGLLEGLLSGSGTTFISGMLAFAVGTRINVRNIGTLLKHQGTLLLVKIVIASILSLRYFFFFGNEGIFGISGIAFLAVMFSINPAVQVSILESYGYEEDAVVMGLSTAVTLPILPTILYSAYASGRLMGINWLPIISVFTPLLLGLILGNVDEEIRTLYQPTVAILLPFLEWNLGQSMNML